MAAEIRLRIRDPRQRRSDIALPEEGEDGEPFVGEEGGEAVLARAVSIVLDAARFDVLGIDLVDDEASAPGATPFRPCIDRHTTRRD